MGPEKMEKLGMVSLPAELAKYQEKYEQKTKAKEQAARARKEEVAHVMESESPRPQDKESSESSMEFFDESLWDPENSPSGWVEDVFALIKVEPGSSADPAAQADTEGERKESHDSTDPTLLALADTENAKESDTKQSSKHHKHRDSKSEKRRKSSGSKGKSDKPETKAAEIDFSLNQIRRK